MSTRCDIPSLLRMNSTASGIILWRDLRYKIP